MVKIKSKYGHLHRYYLLIECQRLIKDLNQTCYIQLRTHHSKKVINQVFQASIQLILQNVIMHKMIDLIRLAT